MVEKRILIFTILIRMVLVIILVTKTWFLIGIEMF